MKVGVCGQMFEEASWWMGFVVVLCQLVDGICGGLESICGGSYQCTLEYVNRCWRDSVGGWDLWWFEVGWWMGFVVVWSRFVVVWSRRRV